MVERTRTYTRPDLPILEGITETVLGLLRFVHVFKRGDPSSDLQVPSRHMEAQGSLDTGCLSYNTEGTRIRILLEIRGGSTTLIPPSTDHTIQGWKGTRTNFRLERRLVRTPFSSKEDHDVSLTVRRSSLNVEVDEQSNDDEFQGVGRLDSGLQLPFVFVVSFSRSCSTSGSCSLTSSVYLVLNQLLLLCFTL